ncbi:MAG: transcription elongation factor GreA [bacterium]|nr:transcription elongation factor GreA [bacterium]
MDQQHITAEKLEELKQELNNLRTVRRLEVADRLKRAKELGDLSENSEYMEARDEQQLVESRAFEIEDIINNSTIITMTSGKSTVGVGATILVSKGTNEMKFSIVGPNEAKPEAGLLSNESPLGRAFIGHKPGDMVKINVPAGEVIYKILKIE